MMRAIGAALNGAGGIAGIMAGVLMAWALMLAPTTTMAQAEVEAGGTGAPFFRPIPVREPGEVRIGVLAFRGVEVAYGQWQPLAEYLGGQIPGRRFTIMPLSLGEIKNAVSGNSVDFLITNPGNYSALEASHGITRIATLKPTDSLTTGNLFGAVIFTRAGRKDITGLSDLRGKTFMAVGRDAFGGFQMAWRELERAGIDPFSDLKEISFVGFPQDQIVHAVIEGRVDVGTARTGLLESMAREGRISLSDINVLSQKDVHGFPYFLSTDLYPEWPLAKLGHTSQELSQQIVIQLLSMTPDHPVAESGGFSGWTVPLDYLPVHEMLKELKIDPYDKPVEITMTDILRQYWQWVVFVMVLLGIAVLWGVRVEQLVNRRTLELSQTNEELTRHIAERKRIEEVARKRQEELAHISRVNTIGEMAASIAHEINQPLSAIANYARGSVRRLKNMAQGDDGETGRILDAMTLVASEAERAASIIKKVRGMVSRGETSIEIIDVENLINGVVEIAGINAAAAEIAITTHIEEGLPPISADRVQVEQVLVNLSTNAIDATQANTENRNIVISAFLGEQNEVIISVRDFGPGIDPKIREDIFRAFYTTKADGMGMGLSISMTIIETCGGRLWLEDAPDGGSLFMFSLPGAGNKGTRGPTHAP